MLNVERGEKSLILTLQHLQPVLVIESLRRASVCALTRLSMTGYLVGFAEYSYAALPGTASQSFGLLADPASCFGNSAAAGCGYYRERTEIDESVLKDAKKNTNAC